MSQDALPELIDALRRALAGRLYLADEQASRMGEAGRERAESISANPAEAQRIREEVSHFKLVAQEQAARARDLAPKVAQHLADETAMTPQAWLHSFNRRMVDDGGLRSLIIELEAAGPFTANAEPRRQKRPVKDAERLVRKYIAEKQAAGVASAEITRDRIAERVGLSAGAVSATEAWQAFSNAKRRETLPDGIPSNQSESEIDAAIQRGDWDSVKSLQDQEQRQVQRKHK
jgi:hypothetical protein